MIRILLCIVCLFQAGVSLAATRYVSDELRITMRSGPSTQNQIIKVLNSGDRLEMLKEQEVNQHDYALVRTSDGKEGWVLTQYLTDTPIARTQIATIKQKLAALQDSNDRLKKELAELKSLSNETLSTKSTLEKSLAETSAELNHIKDISSHALQLDMENKQLSLQLAQLKNEYKLSKTENAALKDRSDREWFIKGAIVVIGSMLFGILLTRIRWQKRRSSWNSSL